MRIILIRLLIYTCRSRYSTEFVPRRLTSSSISFSSNSRPEKLKPCPRTFQDLHPLEMESVLCFLMARQLAVFIRFGSRPPLNLMQRYPTCLALTQIEAQIVSANHSSVAMKIISRSISIPLRQARSDYGSSKTDQACHIPHICVQVPRSPSHRSAS